MSKEKTITFDESAKRDILELFGKTTDDEGYVIEKDDPSTRVLTPDGEEIHIDKFAGITKGSLAFVRSDLMSLMYLSDKMG